MPFTCNAWPVQTQNVYICNTDTSLHAHFYLWCLSYIFPCISGNLWFDEEYLHPSWSQHTQPKEISPMVLCAFERCQGTTMCIYWSVKGLWSTVHSHMYVPVWSFCCKNSLDIITRTPFYSPAQEKLENNCSVVVVDPIICKLWAFVYITLKCAINFLHEFHLCRRTN